MRELTILIILSVLGSSTVRGQEVYRTFKDTRVINTSSTETLRKNQLDVRIGHRFGDFAGRDGGWPTFYGLETASDVLIGAEYGFSDRLMAGLFRTKGAGPLKQLLNLTSKYKVVGQDDSKPVSLALAFTTSISTMQSSDIEGSISNFGQFAHRLVYNAQVIVARKLSNNFAVQLVPAYTHRNLVDLDDTNGIISLGIASRIQLTKVMGLIIDYTMLFSDLRTNNNGYYAPLGIGLEFDTGGHVFQINMTNSTGLVETDYIPFTRSNWLDGQYRLGFTISRLFNL